MNCNNPTIALRISGINPKTGNAYRPYFFHKWKSDEDFVKTYFEFKERKPQVPLKYVDLFSPDRDELQQPAEVLVLPCGKCDLCVRAYKRNWACRCICEAQISNGGQFLTLTCSDESQLETFPNNNLIHKPFQDFMKRLRHPSNVGDLVWLSDNHKIRYFMCGEYGSLSHRAHYHAILFGVDFKDKYFVGMSKSGEPLYSAPVLDRCRFVEGKEVFGKISNYGACSPYDICYTVGYVDKKLFGGSRKVLEDSDGKLYKENPEYVKMSRRPGIGFDWLKKYHTDVWKFYNDQVLQDCVSVQGYKYFPPRYFFDKAKIGDSQNTPLLTPEKIDSIVADRESRVLKVCSSPAAMLESLNRTHAKCVEYRQRQADRCVRENFGEE